MAGKVNPIWEFFERNEPDESKALCKSCKASILLGSKQRKSQTMSCLMWHLQTRHSVSFGKYCQRKERKEADSAASTCATVAAASASVSPGLRQSSIEDSFARRQKWNDSDPRSIHVDQLILEMIILDCQPFSMVLDAGFRKLINELKPQYYRLKSNKFFHDKLDGFYQEICQKLKNELENVQWISCSSDAWSNDFGKNNQAMYMLALHEHT